MNNVTKWWVSICVQLTGLFIAYYTGAIPFILEGDKSYLSIAIFLTWLTGTILIAKNIYDSRNGEIVPDSAYDLPVYIRGLCISLGLIGTIIGFALMFSGIDFGTITVDNMTPVLFSMLYGMKSALFTTLSGVIAYESLRYQLLTRNIT